MPHSVLALPRQRPAPAAVPKVDLEAVPCRIALRHNQGRCACLDRNDTRGRTLPLEGRGDGAAPGAEVRYARKILPQGEIHEQLGFRTRDEHRGIYREVQAVELLVANDVGDGFAAFSPFQVFEKSILDLEGESAFWKSDDARLGKTGSLGE